LSDTEIEAAREVEVTNPEGLHTRPVTRFVDLASTFKASVSVRNLSGKHKDEVVDGTSAMQMILLEATQGSVLRIEARGVDAREAVQALAALVVSGFKDSPQRPP
jgi:phosphotransferase system HPr (HPr) family protein